VSSGNLATRPRVGLLSDHAFRQLFASTTLSQFGIQITMLAISLIAIDHLNASEFEAGLLVTLMSVGFLLVGLPAGAWVDRMRRRHVLIVGDLGRAALLISIPLAWWAEVLTIWQLYAVALVHGILNVFFDVAYHSYLPHLVGRENLVEGNAKLEAVGAVSHLGGPSVAGQLIRLATAPTALVIDAVAMAASALFVLRIRKREEKPIRRADAHLAREIVDGLRFVLGHRLLRPIVASSATFKLFSSIYAAMLIFFLRRDLDVDPGTIGMVLSIIAVGGVLGAFTARRTAGWIGQGQAMWMPIAFTAPFLLLMPLADSGWRLWIAAGGGAVAAAGVAIYNVAQVSFRQGLTPDDLLGRMNATIRFLVWGVMPLGGMVGAVLGEQLGARWALLIGVLGTCLAFLPVFLSPLRTMRSLPTQPVTRDSAVSHV
jgi:MFS family permease